MATKAQKFKAQSQRDAKPSRPSKPRRPRRDDVVDTSKPGVSASDRKAGGASTAKRNVSKRAAAKGGAKLEDSASGTPSRKSTRKSEGRVKAASSLTRRVIRKASSPQARSAKTAARGKK